MALIKIAIVLCASLYAGSAQFTPSASAVCNGRSFVPHPTYCNLYYRCVNDILLQPPMMCGAGTQWDPKTTSCNTLSIKDTGVCSETWTCDPNIRYPDVCCDKYWVCQARNVWLQKSCSNGENFDMSRGICQQGLACNDYKYEGFARPINFCSAHSVLNNNQNDCNLAANPNGDVCSFINGKDVMDCPAGQAFNATACGCSIRANVQCKNKHFPFGENKAYDASCRASFSTVFSNPLQLTAYSDKVGESISDLTATPDLRYGGGFYLGAENAVSISGNQAILSANGYINARYFANNEIHVPTAFVVEFKPTNFMTGSTFNLLTNTFNIPNEVCSSQSAPGLSVSVRNDGFANQGINNNYRYTFSISMSGFSIINGDISTTINDLSIVVPQSSTSNLGVSESGSSLNMIRFTLTLGDNLNASAEVVELNNNENTVARNAAKKTVAFPIRNLKSSRCGLTVGSTMSGSVSRFTVYEGCGNGFANLI